MEFYRRLPQLQISPACLLGDAIDDGGAPPLQPASAHDVAPEAERCFVPPGFYRSRRRGARTLPLACRASSP